MSRLVVLGGGFAGVWAALGAAEARRRDTSSRARLSITLVSRDAWLTIRPRLYESSLENVRVPLDPVVALADVNRVEGHVTAIDSASRIITLDTAAGTRRLPYDRLVLAAGSRLQRPMIPGAEHAFAVDTYAEAVALDRHLAALPLTADDGARFAAVVVGAGFTGIEVATELAARVGSVAERNGAAGRARVTVVERGSVAVPTLTRAARANVHQALEELGIELRVGQGVTSIAPDGVALDSGEFILARTTVWTGGFRGSALAAQLGVDRDDLGRLPVDEYLRVRGVDAIYAAGDIARAMADAEHVAPMSCQHAIPMGDVAGANAAAELLGLQARAYTQPDHVTCLDLGAAGALFLQGWGDAAATALTGFWAKRMKETINTRLIYPPSAPPTSMTTAACGHAAA